MPIIVERSSRVICQGVLSDEEIFHLHQCKLYGTQVVAWVKAGSGGGEKLGLPIFDSVKDAKWHTSASHSMIFVDPPFVADAVEEAVESGISTILCHTKNVPLHDMVEIQYVLSKNPKSRLIGPGSPGVITPSQCKAGVMPAYIFTPGSVGIVSSSDTLGYEAAFQLTQAGFGQTTFVGLGGQPIRGLSFVEVLSEFEADPATEITLMVVRNGENGMDDVAAWIEKGRRKPVLAVIAGHTVPLNRYTTSVLTGENSSGATTDILRKAGVHVIEDISLIPSVVEQVLAQIRFME